MVLWCVQTRLPPCRPRQLTSRAARTICQIFAFVNENSTTSNPRIANIKAVRLCGLKYLMVNMLVCAALPPASLSFPLAEALHPRRCPSTRSYGAGEALQSRLLWVPRNHRTLHPRRSRILHRVGDSLDWVRFVRRPSWSMVLTTRTRRVLFGIEMNPMFRNPNGASNIRDFWARCESSSPSCVEEVVAKVCCREHGHQGRPRSRLLPL